MISHTWKGNTLIRHCAWLHGRGKVNLEENDFWSPFHPSVLMLGWHLPGADVLGCALLEPCSARQFPHSPLRDLTRKSWRRKHRHTVSASKLILSPQGQSSEENSVCPCHLCGKSFLLPLVCTLWVWKGLAIGFSLSLMVPGRLGAPAELSWCSLGWARKEPGHSCLGCNRRHPWHHFRAGSLQVCGPSGFEICISKA